MKRVQSWSRDDFRENVELRWRKAKKYRELFEARWQNNDATINTAGGDMANQFNLTFTDVVELEGGEVDAGNSHIAMNYAFKYVRFFHSQLSSNPPATIVEPASTDPSDKRKADVADRIVRHAMVDQRLQEVSDQQALSTLIYGNGWIKCIQDPNKGDVLEYNRSTREILMEGDIDTYSPSVFNMWIDPDAKRWQDVRYVFEKKTLSVEEAKFVFPDEAEMIEETYRAKQDQWELRESVQDIAGEGNIDIYEMYEKGAPINGMDGRHCFFLGGEDNVVILGEPKENPHPNAGLPYQLLTYVDVPDQVFGISTVDYVARLQQMLNSLDTSFLDNIQAHHAIRLLVHADTKFEDEAFSNSPWDFIVWDGSHPPSHMPSPQLLPDAWRFRDQLVTAIQEIYGVNDSMMGIQRREQSSLSQQTSIESGTMMHRRLFKKYAMCMEALYKDYLELVKAHWDIPRQIRVTGKEKAFDTALFSGADIKDGWDLRVSYGTSLPLDPNMKREAILLLQPMLKEAGMSPKQILNMMKLNEIESMHDRMSMSADRQREIFDEMIAKNREGKPTYIAPRKNQEHAGMLEYAHDYVMTAEFRDLEPALQELIEKHIEEREDIAGKKAAAGAPQVPTGDPAAGAPHGMPGVGGALPPVSGPALV